MSLVGPPCRAPDSHDGVTKAAPQRLAGLSDCIDLEVDKAGPKKLAAAEIGRSRERWVVLIDLRVPNDD